MHRDYSFDFNFSTHGYYGIAHIYLYLFGLSARCGNTRRAARASWFASPICDSKRRLDYNNIVEDYPRLGHVQYAYLFGLCLARTGRVPSKLLTTVTREGCRMQVIARLD